MLKKCSKILDEINNILFLVVFINYFGKNVIFEGGKL